MDKRQIMTAFNNHLMEFCQEVIKLFPENYNLQTAYKFLESLKRYNPKKIIEMWHLKIYSKYKEQIENNDFAFFEDKDYQSDFDPNNSVTIRILNVINEIRTSVKNSSKENKMKALKYGQNLNRLCELYFV
tara:strand:+ start:91 stop:483 length:393 start_codon:yes stop_codon:yes gene_type:complete